jgi:hypothetical protein
MSQLSVNAITNAAGGNTATINGMTPTADSLQGFRNRLFNGGMVIDQRNNGASVAIANAAAYRLDRWFTGINTPSAATAIRSTIAPPGFSNSLLITVTTGASVGSVLNYLQQPIEGFNTSDFAFGTASAVSVTLSFWVRSSVTGIFGGSLRNSSTNAGTRSYPFTYSITAANTWEQKSVIIAPETVGITPAGNTEGLSVFFDLGSGTLQGTPGAWASANLIGATGTQTALMSTNGATFYITGVQLEAGSVATPFERRPIGTELALCQRYYEVLTVLFMNTAWATIANQIGWKVQKRAAPTVTSTPSAGTGGTYTTQSDPYSVFQNNPNSTQSGGTVTGSAEL